jgi:hypothetical protein
VEAVRREDAAGDVEELPPTLLGREARRHDVGAQTLDFKGMT